MYPRAELIRLAAHKAALRGRIAQRRSECVEAAARVLRPLVWVDKTVAVVRRLSPLVRWGPLVFAAARRFSAR